MKAASAHQIPFVAVCGGHSLWSTIANHGFVLDFTRFKSVNVEPAKHQVTVAGGILMKELSTALAEKGECTGGKYLSLPSSWAR